MKDYKKEDLEALILEKNKSYSFIGRLYGVSGAAIKKAAKKLGIPLPKRRKINEKEKFSHTGFKGNSNVNKISKEEFTTIINNSSSWKEIGEKLGYKNGISRNVKNAILHRCSKLGVEPHIYVKNGDILERTKGELFQKRKNWQSARSTIRKLARDYYEELNPDAKCVVCGYSKHIEVAHIKAVSDFDDNTTIKEINSIDNLIALCPNHHWEYDNGIIKI